MGRFSQDTDTLSGSDALCGDYEVFFKENDFVCRLRDHLFQYPPATMGYSFCCFFRFTFHHGNYLYAVFISGQAVTGWASLAILISVLGAVILLMLGIIGEYLGKMFMQCKNRPEYIVRSGNSSSSFNV